MNIVNLFSKLKGKKIIIKVKNFSTTGFNEYKGVLIEYYASTTNIFIELDTKEIINIKYIESITMN